MVQRDMVFTIEPSVTSKFGTCNLEQDVLVTSNGYQELSKPQEAIIQLGRPSRYPSLCPPLRCVRFGRDATVLSFEQCRKISRRVYQTVNDGFDHRLMIDHYVLPDY